MGYEKLFNDLYMMKNTKQNKIKLTLKEKYTFEL